MSVTLVRRNEDLNRIGSSSSTPASANPSANHNNTGTSSEETQQQGTNSADVISVVKPQKVRPLDTDLPLTSSNKVRTDPRLPYPSTVAPKSELAVKFEHDECCVMPTVSIATAGAAFLFLVLAVQLIPLDFLGLDSSSATWMAATERVAVRAARSTLLRVMENVVIDTERVAQNTAIQVLTSEILCWPVAETDSTMSWMGSSNSSTCADVRWAVAPLLPWATSVQYLSDRATVLRQTRFDQSNVTSAREKEFLETALRNLSDGNATCTSTALLHRLHFVHDLDWIVPFASALIARLSCYNQNTNGAYRASFQDSWQSELIFPSGFYLSVFCATIDTHAAAAAGMEDIVSDFIGITSLVYLPDGDVVVRDIMSPAVSINDTLAWLVSAHRRWSSDAAATTDTNTSHRPPPLVNVTYHARLDVLTPINTTHVFRTLHAAAVKDYARHSSSETDTVSDTMGFAVNRSLAGSSRRRAFWWRSLVEAEQSSMFSACVGVPMRFSARRSRNDNSSVAAPPITTVGVCVQRAPFKCDAQSPDVFATSVDSPSSVGAFFLDSRLRRIEAYLGWQGERRLVLPYNSSRCECTSTGQRYLAVPTSANVNDSAPVHFQSNLSLHLAEMIGFNTSGGNRNWATTLRTATEADSDAVLWQSIGGRDAQQAVLSSWKNLGSRILERVSSTFALLQNTLTCQESNLDNSECTADVLREAKPVQLHQYTAVKASHYGAALPDGSSVDFVNVEPSSAVAIAVSFIAPLQLTVMHVVSNDARERLSVVQVALAFSQVGASIVASAVIFTVLRHLFMPLRDLKRFVKPMDANITDAMARAHRQPRRHVVRRGRPGTRSASLLSRNPLTSLFSPSSRGSSEEGSSGSGTASDDLDSNVEWTTVPKHEHWSRFVQLRCREIADMVMRFASLRWSSKVLVEALRHEQIASVAANLEAPSQAIAAQEVRLGGAVSSTLDTNNAASALDKQSTARGASALASVAVPSMLSVGMRVVDEVTGCTAVGAPTAHPAPNAPAVPKIKPSPPPSLEVLPQQATLLRIYFPLDRLPQVEKDIPLASISVGNYSNSSAGHLLRHHQRPSSRHSASMWRGAAGMSTDGDSATDMQSLPDFHNSGNNLKRPQPTGSFEYLSYIVRDVAQFGGCIERIVSHQEVLVSFAVTGDAAAPIRGGSSRTIVSAAAQAPNPAQVAQSVCNAVDCAAAIVKSVHDIFFTATPEWVQQQAVQLVPSPANGAPVITVCVDHGEFIIGSIVSGDQLETFPMGECVERTTAMQYMRNHRHSKCCVLVSSYAASKICNLTAATETPGIQRSSTADVLFPVDVAHAKIRSGLPKSDVFAVYHLLTPLCVAVGECTTWSPSNQPRHAEHLAVRVRRLLEREHTLPQGSLVVASSGREQSFAAGSPHSEFFPRSAAFAPTSGHRDSGTAALESGSASLDLSISQLAFSIRDLLCHALIFALSSSAEGCAETCKLLVSAHALVLPPHQASLSLASMLAGLNYCRQYSLSPPESEVYSSNSSSRGLNRMECLLSSGAMSSSTDSRCGGPPHSTTHAARSPSSSAVAHLPLFFTDVLHSLVQSLETALQSSKSNPQSFTVSGSFAKELRNSDSHTDNAAPAGGYLGTTTPHNKRTSFSPLSSAAANSTSALLPHHRQRSIRSRLPEERTDLAEDEPPQEQQADAPPAVDMRLPVEVEDAQSLKVGAVHGTGWSASASVVLRKIPESNFGVCIQELWEDIEGLTTQNSC